jgi:hypothetical protein
MRYGDLFIHGKQTFVQTDAFDISRNVNLWKLVGTYTCVNKKCYSFPGNICVMDFPSFVFVKVNYTFYGISVTKFRKCAYSNGLFIFVSAGKALRKG